jgi:hypothetical protein
MRRDEHTASRRWPFWLLIAAWVSANSPQAATYAVFAWLADARDFSHQQQLTRDVAHLLAGEKAPARATPVVVANDEREPTTQRSAFPAAAVLKKIDLSSEKENGLARPASIALRYLSPADCCS